MKCDKAGILDISISYNIVGKQLWSHQSSVHMQLHSNNSDNYSCDSVFHYWLACIWLQFV